MQVSDAWMSKLGDEGDVTFPSGTELDVDAVEIGFTENEVVSGGDYHQNFLRQARRVQKKLRERYPRNWFTDNVSRRPVLILFLFCIPPVICAIISSRFSVKLDLGIDAFSIRDHPVADHDDMYSIAVDGWRDARPKELDSRRRSALSSRGQRTLGPGGRATDLSIEDSWHASIDHVYAYSPAGSAAATRSYNESSRRSAERRHLHVRAAHYETLSFPEWRIQVAYVLKDPKTGKANLDDNSNVLLDEHMEFIHGVEMKIKSLSGYTDYCYSTVNIQGRHCRPPNSLMNYIFATVERDELGNIVSITPDGEGQRKSVAEVVPETLKSGVGYWFLGTKVSGAHLKSAFVRSQFSFALPLPGYNSDVDRRDEQVEKVEEFLRELVELLKESATDEVEVLYGGKYVTNYEVRKLVTKDGLIGITAIVVITIYMWVHTGSLFIALLGTTQILLSFPLSYFCYRVVFQYTYIGVVNLLTVYIIMGIAVDDIFVFTDTFFRSGFITTALVATVPLGEDGVSQAVEATSMRLADAYAIAGKAMFMTSFTTTVAFVANLLSSIPVIRTFCLFMALLVVANYLLTMTFFAAVMAVYEKHVAHRPSLFKMIKQRVTNIYGMEFGTIGGEDESLWESEDGEAEVPGNVANVDGLHTSPTFRLIERFFRYYYAPFFFKGRRKFVTLGLYSCVVVVLLGLATQLSPSDKVPALFPSDHPLQRWIDMGQNHFAAGMACDACSGFVEPDCASGELVDVCGTCGGDKTDKMACHQLSKFPTSFAPGSLPTNEWVEIVPDVSENTLCGDGSPWSFFVNVKAAGPAGHRILLEYQGGGACWDEKSCASYQSNISLTLTAFNSNKAGVFDPPGTFNDRAENPFREWTHVYIPYCTGDLHTGSGPREYSSTLTVHHVGGVNALAAVRWLTSGRWKISQMTIGGCSAGGYAAIAWAPAFLTATWPSSPDFLVFSDSATGAVSKASEALVAWGSATSALPAQTREVLIEHAFDVTKLWRTTSEAHPHARFAQVTSLYDATQVAYASALNERDVSAREWSDAMIESLASLETVPTGNFHAFVRSGASHCLISSDDMYTDGLTSIDSDEAFLEWVSSVAAPVCSLGCYHGICVKSDTCHCFQNFLPPTCLEENTTAPPPSPPSPSPLPPPSPSPPPSPTPPPPSSPPPSPSPSPSPSPPPPTSPPPPPPSPPPSPPPLPPPPPAPSLPPPSPPPPSLPPPSPPPPSLPPPSPPPPSPPSPPPPPLPKGCDHVPGSDMALDLCGVCGGHDECVGCDGVPHSGLVVDVCNKCGGQNDCVGELTTDTEQIHMMWGIKGIDRSDADTAVFSEHVGEPIFDNTFDLSDVHAQQAIVNTCEAAALNTELVRPGGVKCFMLAYKQWKLDTGRAFPDPSPNSFMTTVHAFLVANRGKYRDDIAFEYHEGQPVRVLWHKISLRSYLRSGVASFPTQKVYDSFEEFVAERNKVSPETCNKAFQTTDIWVRIFTEITAVNGIVYSISISLGLTLFAVLMFTGSVHMAALVFITLCSIVASVLGLLFAAGWKLGAIEALSVSILLGASVDYLIHMTEGYLHASTPAAQAKFRRRTGVDMSRYDFVREALTQVGISVANSSISTMLAVSLILFCTLRIFTKLATLILLILFVSVLMSIGFFAALLAVIGPKKVERTRKRMMIYAGVIITCCLCAVFVLFMIIKVGKVEIAGPSGEVLFS